jgi:phage gpG-like protein
VGSFDDSGLQKTLSAMLQRAETPQKPLREIGFLMAQEMKTNIDQGGRPGAWKKSIRAERLGGQTLRDSGTLMNSMTSEVQGNSVAAGPTAVGRKKLSDPRILAILARGGTIQAKNKPYLRFPIPGGGWARKKQVTIPARDYTYVPSETTETFGEIVRRYVVG